MRTKTFVGTVLLLGALVATPAGHAGTLDLDGILDLIGKTTADTGSADASCGAYSASASGTGRPNWTGDASAVATMTVETYSDSGGYTDSQNRENRDAYASGYGGGSATGRGGLAYRTCDSRLLSIAQTDDVALFDLVVSCDGESAAGLTIVGDLMSDPNGGLWLVGAVTLPNSVVTPTSLSTLAPEGLVATGFGIEYIFSENGCSAVLV